MQRSITNQKLIITKIIYVLMFAVYESLTSVYLFLPPLFAVLFILFSNALRDENVISLLFISICLLIFEADKGYLIFSSIIFFTLLYKFLIPKLSQNLHCESCVKASSVFIVYLGFYLFSLLISNIFLLEKPDINYYIVYYIIIELFLVSLL